MFSTRPQEDDMYPFAMYPYAIIALDLANERAREAAHDRLVAEARAGLPTRNSFPRRALANGLALVSRGSAAAVRRLDECVADDLGRSLAPTE
jgi:hypothetical protein